MHRALDGADMEMPEAPARWGALRQHVFYGALYHGFLLAGEPPLRAVKPGIARSPSGRSSGSTSSASR
jgi:capsular polysaccharide export protein